jgi:UDP-glucose:(heptosyl)LPS alpha-1,3-glucosyltransferase
VLLFVGWEFKRKGLQYIIEALSKLDKSVKLLVVGGDDPLKFQLLAQHLGVSARVSFVGHKGDVKAYYAASDIFVFPSEYEPFGLVITEAMAAGLPVITMRSAGAAEIITSGQDGVLLENHDPASIAYAVQSLINWKSQERLGGAARKTALRYSWDALTEKTLNVFKEVK